MQVIFKIVDVDFCAIYILLETETKEIQPEKYLDLAAFVPVSFFLSVILHSFGLCFTVPSEIPLSFRSMQSGTETSLVIL